MDKDNINIEKQKFQMNKSGFNDLSNKIDELISVTKGATIGDLLSKYFLSIINDLRQEVRDKNSEYDTEHKKEKEEWLLKINKIESDLRDLTTENDDNSIEQIKVLCDKLSLEIAKVRKDIPTMPDLTGITAKISDLDKKIVANELQLKQKIVSIHETIKHEMPEKDTPDEMVELLQTVKRPWLSIEAIDGDFNTKVTKQFGGGNTTPLEVRVNGVSYGGAREVNFVGSGVAAEIINGIVTVTVAGGGNAMVDNEVVSGSDTTFTLSQMPVAGTVHLYALGQRLKLTTDYSISGVDITTVSSWSAGELTADYQI